MLDAQRNHLRIDHRSLRKWKVIRLMVKLSVAGGSMYAVIGQTGLKEFAAASLNSGVRRKSVLPAFYVTPLASALRRE